MSGNDTVPDGHPHAKSGFKEELQSLKNKFDSTSLHDAKAHLIVSARCLFPSLRATHTDSALRIGSKWHITVR